MSRLAGITVAGVVAVCLVTAGASGDVVDVTVPNGSFESIVSGTSPSDGNWLEEATPTSASPSGVLSDWSFKSNDPWSTFDGQGNPGTSGNIAYSSTVAPDGSYVGMLKSSPSSGTEDKAYAWTTAPIATIAADTDYTLTVDVGYPGFGSTFSYSTAWQMGFDTNPAALNLNGPLDMDEYIRIDNGVGLTSGNFTELTTTLTQAEITAGGLVGQDLYVVFWWRGGQKSMTNVDNIRVEADGPAAPPIPEPATMALLGIGGLGGLICRQRK